MILDHSNIRLMLSFIIENYFLFYDKVWSQMGKLVQIMFKIIRATIECIAKDSCFSYHSQIEYFFMSIVHTLHFFGERERVRISGNIFWNSLIFKYSRGTNLECFVRVYDITLLQPLLMLYFFYNTQKSIPQLWFSHSLFPLRPQHSVWIATEIESLRDEKIDFEYRIFFWHPHCVYET